MLKQNRRVIDRRALASPAAVMSSTLVGRGLRAGRSAPPLVAIDKKQTLRPKRASREPPARLAARARRPRHGETRFFSSGSRAELEPIPHALTRTRVAGASR